MSITDKFNYLKQTKENLKEVINLVKDEDEDKLTEESTFRSYPEALRKNYIKALNEGSNFIYDSLDKMSNEGDSAILDNTVVAPMKISLNGNTSQEVITGEDGNEIVDTEINVSDVNTSKENYITLQGNINQEVIEEDEGIEIIDTSIFVNDVDTEKRNYVTLKGNTNQKIYKGTNLIGLYTDITEKNGIQITSEEDGSLTLRGTPTTAFFDIELKYLPLIESGKTYRIKTIPTNYPTTAISQILLMANSTRLFGTGQVFASGKTISPVFEGTYNRALFRIEGLSTSTEYDVNIKMQLEEGQSITHDYERFVGGMPSPSPDFPQEVKVVKGVNYVRVTKGINIGNLEVGNINSSTGITEVSAKAIRTKDYLELADETTYQLSAEASKELKTDIFYYDANKKFLGNETPQGTPYGFAPMENAKYLKFILYYLDDSDIASVDEISKIILADAGSIIPLDLTKNTLLPYVYSPYQDSSDGVDTIISYNYIRVNGTMTAELGTEIGIKEVTLPTGKYNFNAGIENPSLLSYYGELRNVNDSSETYVDEDGLGIDFEIKEEKTFRFYFIMKNGASFDNLTFAPVLLNREDTSYELCKIGDYQDYLYKKDDKWYKHKEIKKFVCDDTLDYRKSNNNSSFYVNENIYNGCILPENNYTIPQIIANQLKANTGSNVWINAVKNTIGVYRDNTSNPRLNFGDITGAELRAHLKENPLVFYAPLIEPIEEEITDLLLISALDNLYQLQLESTTKVETIYNEIKPYIDFRYNIAIPSPSPEKPSEVKVVEGENVVSVQGKNLFDVTKHTNTLEANTTIISANEYTCNVVTAWRGRVIVPINDFKKNTDYTFSYVSNNPRSIMSRISGVKDGVSTILVSNYYYQYTNKATINTDEYDQIVVDLFATGNNNTIENTIISNIQFEEGTTITSFVPYSKTDYPINLVSKNLFSTENLVNATLTDTGEYLTGNNRCTGDYVFLDKSQENLALSFNLNILFIGIAFYDESKQYLSRATINNTNLLTAPIPTNAEYCRPFFQFMTNPTAKIDAKIVQQLGTQLEYGTERTNYVLYFTPIELCKINTYKDYFHKDSGKWYVHKEIGKKIFDGTENWSASSTQTTGYYRFSNASLQGVILPPSSNDEALLAYFNTFETISANNTYRRHNGISCRTSGNYIDVYYDQLAEGTAEDFKTWLSTHNTIVYYVLAEPVETEITSLTLIEQLDNLYTAQLNNEVNYVNTETENLLPYIDLKYNVVTQMPSPDRASEINKVTGNNVISVQGKNLLDTSNARNDKTWLTRNSDGSLTLNYPSGLNVNFTDLFENNINIPTDNYILKIFMEGTFVGGNLIVKNTNGNYIGQTPIRNGNAITITNSDIGNIQFYVVSAGTNCTIKLELEKGTPTSYVPYSKTDYPINLGTLELCKINNYKDSLFKAINGNEYYDSLTEEQKNALVYGKWYLHKEIEKVIFDGSENWIERRNADNVKQFRGNKTIRYVGTSKQFCNYAIYNSIAYNFGRVGQFVIATDYIFVCVDDNAVLNNFKTTIATNNLIGYYPLTTSTDTQITDITLIEQLEAIAKAKSIKDKTYITQTNEEIPFIIDATAIKKYEEVQ